jgi:hypothetical protein
LIPFHYYLMVYLVKIVYGICYLECYHRLRMDPLVDEMRTHLSVFK